MNIEVEIENLLDKLNSFRDKNMSGCSVFNLKKELRQRVFPLKNNNTLQFNVENNKVDIILKAENYLIYSKIFEINSLSQIEISESETFNFENIIKDFSLKLPKKEQKKVLIKDMFIKENQNKLNELYELNEKKIIVAKKIDSNIEEVNKKVEEYKQKLFKKLKMEELLKLQQTLYHEKKSAENYLDNSLEAISKKENADFKTIKSFLKINIY